MSVAPARRPALYLGIDLGGTNIKSGVVDESGQSRSSVSVETNAGLGPEVGLESLARAGELAVKESGFTWADIAAVGLGSPGTMDLSRGMLLDPPNLPGWRNLAIQQRLGERLGKPTVLQNDANAAAFGEFWAGAGRGARSLVLFTLGTGVGCGIVQEGRIIEGRHSHGGECGHIIIQMHNGRKCSCGGYGHLEAYASATALVQRAREAVEIHRTSTMASAAQNGTLTSRDVSAAAQAGDQPAKLLMRDTARYLAVGAVCLMHTIDPDVILFSGGMIAAGRPFLDDIRSDIRTLAFPVPAENTRVEFAELGGDAGFIGAAGCARSAFGPREL